MDSAGMSVAAAGGDFVENALRGIDLHFGSLAIRTAFSLLRSGAVNPETAAEPIAKSVYTRAYESCTRVVRGCMFAPLVYLLVFPPTRA